MVSKLGFHGGEPQFSYYFGVCRCVAESDVDADEQATAAAGADDAARNQDNRGCQATSMMSRISGVRRARTASSSSFSKLDRADPPTYGVDDVPDSILTEVAYLY